MYTDNTIVYIYIYIYICIYIYLYIYIYIYIYISAGALGQLARLAGLEPNLPTKIIPILSFVDSNFPGSSPWT